jgi:hypothetical protein
MLALALTVLLTQYVNPYSGISWNNALPSYLDSAVCQRIWARTTQKPGGVKAAPRSPLTATDFTPAQPRSVAASLVAASKGMSKGQGQALVEGLNAGLDAFERETRKNNVAYALAFLIGVSMQTVSGREVSDAESDMLAQAINDELAASSSFKKLPVKQKQLLYETCIVVGSLIGGMAAQAEEAKDVELMQQAQMMAKTALQTFQGK